MGQYFLVLPRQNQKPLMPSSFYQSELVIMDFEFLHSLTHTYVHVSSEYQVKGSKCGRGLLPSSPACELPRGIRLDSVGNRILKDVSLWPDAAGLYLLVPLIF